jgi:hypothetical protein
MSNEPQVQEAPAEEEAPGRVELALPHLELGLGGAGVRVVRKPDSDERALAVGPLLLTIVLPFDAEGARALARDLTGGVQLASALPAMAVPKRRPL